MPEDKGQLKGFFIAESDLPPETWTSFFHLSKAQRMAPKDLIKFMIIREVESLKDAHLPILDQIIKKSIYYLRSIGP
jgi:hypothetical protein